MIGLAGAFGRGSFSHGIHPAEHKQATSALPIERMPFVDEYVLPLSQHIGRPSKPAVRPGQSVERGQLIAEADGFVSTALHAPVTGTVKTIELRPHPNGKKAESIVIATDRFASQRLERSAGAPAAEDFIGRIQQAGMVGLGGAAFPTHVKLQVPKGKRVNTVVLNGCECEPYLTCDHRIMVESPDKVVRGLRLIMAHLGVARSYIGVEANKPDAVEALRLAVGDEGDIEVLTLTVKYPQGAEKMLIDAILKRRVPTGGLPLDLEIVVNNVATAAAMADLFDRGTPLVERALTVTGDGVRRPRNLVVPLGTPVSAVIAHCGGLAAETAELILGGPMMGMAQKDLDVPVLKGTSGILALCTPYERVEEEPCIRCGRCLEACPMFLNPSRFALLVRNERAEELKAHHLLDCFECASCSFSCPSHIPLVQLIRVGKGMVRGLKATG